MCRHVLSFCQGGGEPGNEARPDHIVAKFQKKLDTSMWFNRNGAPSPRAVVCIAEGTADN